MHLTNEPNFQGSYFSKVICQLNCQPYSLYRIYGSCREFLNLISVSKTSHLDLPRFEALIYDERPPFNYHNSILKPVFEFYNFYFFLSVFSDDEKRKAFLNVCVLKFQTWVQIEQGKDTHSDLQIHIVCLCFIPANLKKNMSPMDNPKLFQGGIMMLKKMMDKIHVDFDKQI